MRGRVRQRRDGGFEVVWYALRRFDSEEEARLAATFPEPPPARQQRTSEELSAFLTKLHDGGATLSALANALNAADVPGVRGGRWFPSSVRGVVQRHRARRESLDEKARIQEWTLDDEPVRQDRTTSEQP